MPSERVQRRIDSLLDRAELASDDSNWDQVLELTAGVLEADPDNADAQTFRAMAEASMDQAGSTPPPVPSNTPASTVEDAPTSFANGRYEVIRLLGEGGKKRVYLAHDTTLDRDVAFGLIKAEGLDAASRQRITREAQAMARLGDHPNLMPIFDLGEENGQPYMVQPLMVGGDIERLIEEAEDGRLALEDALRISSEICRGLEFAHSKGIIHRDLKPGNVWLTDDGTVRIGDFGLAISLDRSRLTQEKVMVGTVSYMPPEQATGGEVTPKADLYSLGAMLYEMVTGRPPFMGDDDIAIIGQHVNTPPVAPSWHNQSLPQTLDSLIMRLLSKDPAQRPSSAAEVLQALEAIDPSDAAVAREEGQGSLDSMSGGVFVGRHREMDQLKAAFEETLGGHGKMAALVGEPGVGKTRTAQELATYASMRRGQVLWGRCYEGGGAPPYYPWVQAIRSYVLDRDAETVRREMGSTASVISEIVQDVKERLPDLQSPPQLDDPESARFRLFDSITTFLKTASGTQPIVLMLEDLHWSDKPSLMLLEFVARDLGNSRLMIVGNYRDMELNRRHPLSVTLGELTRERLFDRVLLRGLQKHDVRRFIEVAAGIDPPGPLVDAVFTQTEGNPLFVTETVRLLIQEGDIVSGVKSGGGTSSWEIRIPEGVREVIGRRLDRLSERCNVTLMLAAVIGRQFRFGVLMKLAEDVSENMLLDVLDEALDARIVEEVPTEVGLYQFAHALIQETLKSELSANRTVRLHARIAEALEALYGDEANEHATELVQHFAEAETLLGAEKLIRYSVAAGERAMEAPAPGDALAHFERAEAAVSDPDCEPLMGRIWFGFAMAVNAIFDADRMEIAWNKLVRAFDWYVANDDMDAAIAVAQHPSMFNVIQPDAVGFYDHALELAPPDSTAAGWINACLASALNGSGDLDSAVQAAERAAEIAQRTGDERLESYVLYCKTNASLASDDPESALVSAQTGLTMSRRHGYLQSKIRLMYFACQAHVALGDVQSARSLADELSRDADQLKDATYANSAVSARCGIAWLTGDRTSVFNLADQYHLRGMERVSQRGWLVDAAVCEFGGSVDVEALQERAQMFLARMTSLSYDVRAMAFLAGAAPSLDTDDLWAVVEAAARKMLGFIGEDRRILTRSVADMCLALVAVNSRDATLAGDQYERLKHRAGKFDPWVFLSCDRVLGQLATVLGDWVAAVRHFEEALAFSRRAGFVRETVWTHIGYTKVLLDRNAPGDREKATELQDEAIAIATKLGMKPLLERVLAQREILKA